MANMFMKVGEHKVKGAATAVFTGLDSVSKEGWFTVRSFSWHASRSICMDIGNGFNRNAGKLSLSEITVTKEMDGATEVLMSRFMVPGEEGDTVHVIVTKPDRAGKGAEVYLHVELEKARIVDGSTNIADGATPFECYAVAYNRIMVKHWNENEGGKLEPGGEVTFDLPSGKALSHAIEGA